jgi:hypothetical protein
MRYTFPLRRGAACLAAVVLVSAAAACGGNVKGYWRRDGAATAQVGERVEHVQVSEHWEFGQDRKESYAHTVQYFVSSTGQQFPQRMEAGTYTLRGDTLVLLRDRFWERPPGTIPELPGAQNLRPVRPVRIAVAAAVSDTALVLGGCAGTADCASLSGVYHAFDPATYFDNLEEANRKRPVTSVPRSAP